MHESLYAEMHQMEQDHWWFTGRRAVVNQMARRYQPKLAKQQVRVCELGCGTGGNLLPWCGDHEVVGVEPSSQAREFASKKVDGRIVDGTLPDQLGVEPAAWDLVLMTDVLEHVEDDYGSAKAALNLLRPGGVLVATVPAYPWLFSPRDTHHHHFRRYTKQRFRELFAREDCKTRVLSHYNSFLFPPAAAVRLASKWLPASRAEQDLRMPGKFINRTLHGIFAAEKHLLPFVSLPFGLSLLAVVEKSSVASSKQVSQAA